MRVGTSVVDITPPTGSELSGYVARVQPSLGVYDRLWAQALYLEEGAERLLWLHADCIGLEREAVSAIRRRLETVHGFPGERIVVSATHTHSGPATIHLTHCGAYDAAYGEFLETSLCEAAAKALRDPQPASLYWGEGQCGLSADRRQRGTAHVDPLIGVFAWRDAASGCLAVWVNYAIHHVALGPENRFISGDLAGRATAVLRERFLGYPAVLMTNGACGNINPKHHVRNFEELDAWGNELAACVERAPLEPVSGPVLSVRGTRLSIPLDPMDAGDIRRWAERLRAGTHGAMGYVPERVRATADIWEARMLARCAAGSLATEVETEIQVIRLGDTALVCMGAEVFSPMAEELRTLTGRRMYVVGYANGVIGYVPTAEAYDEGGYEVESAFIYYDGQRPRRDAFDLLRDRAAELVLEAFSGA